MPEDLTYHDDITLMKVYRALDEVFDQDGWTNAPAAAETVISALQNAGILFRERLPDSE